MATPRRVTRRDAEVFMRRLSGYDGEKRGRLVREHRDYIAGARDRDADFGDDDGASLPAPPPPPTTGFPLGILFVHIGVSPVTPSRGDATRSEGHSLAMDEEWVEVNGIRKRRQRQCKGHYPGNTRTCYAIWHDLWRIGRDRPKPRFNRGIQMRPPGKKAGSAGDASTEGGAASEGETVGDDDGSSDGDTTPE
ncbi:hypothetical protein PInf_019620 [Phytophthora infestans]|nr:hypothetical protein PInf_019620 [Phytophthora infestans]